MSARSRLRIGIGVCAVVSLLGSTTVFAQAPETSKEAESTFKSMGFKIYGAVDASYTQNFNNPSTNVNSMRIFDTQANSFSPNVAQIVFEKTAVASGSAMDRVGFRSRTSFGPNSRFSRARTNYQPGQDSSELDIQELYAEYIAPIGNGLKIQAGKIHTLIGFEQINSWDNPNFSRTNMFGLSQAFTTTGIRFTYTFNPMVTASIGLINGWDNIEDNNRSKSFEYLVAVTPHERFGFSVYGSYGAEQSNGNAAFGNAATGVCTNYTPGCDPSAKRTVVGAIITGKVTKSDTIILEPYYGNESNARAAESQNARWNGIGAYHIHDFNDAWSTRIRGTIWEDAGGVRSCVGGNNFNGGTNSCAGGPGGFQAGAVTPTPGAGFNTATGGGVAQTVWDLTFTLQNKLAPALITRAEFRYDKSDKNVFLQGDKAVNNQQTLAFQVIYLF